MTEEELRDALKELVDRGGEIATQHEWGTTSIGDRLVIGETTTAILVAFAELRAERDLLLQAVEWVEWMSINGKYYECPWCHATCRHQHHDHAPDCLRQRALGVVE